MSTSPSLAPPPPSRSPNTVVFPITSSPPLIHTSNGQSLEPGPSPLRQSWDGSNRGQDLGATQSPVKKRSSRRIASDGFDNIKAFMTKRSRKRPSGGFLLETSEKLGTEGQDSGRTTGDTSGIPKRWGKQNAAFGVRGLPDSGTTHIIPTDSSAQQRQFQGPSAWRSNELQGRASLESNDRNISASKSSSTNSRQSLRSSSLPFVAEEVQGAEQLPRSNAILNGPTDIVRMALTLNESRRLHLGPGRLASPTSSNARRSISIGVPPSSGVTSHLTSVRGVSHEIPRSSFNRPSMDRPSMEIRSPGLSATSERDLDDPLASTMLHHDYEFSAATLERADKARSALELSYEYRRLLQLLPPLHSAALSRVSTASSNPSNDEEGQVLRDRHSQAQLGRPYNPLQYMRNRKVRARERQVIDIEAEGWHNVTAVNSWIDQVEEDASHEGFIQDDVVLLPSWEHHSHSLLLGAPINGINTVAIKKNRPKQDWLLDPAELLADAYWLEQGTNKTLIEDSKGSKVFERFRRPRALMFEPPARRNSSYHKPAQSNDFGSPWPAESATSPKSLTNSDSDTDSYTEQVIEPAYTHESRASRLKRRIFRVSRSNSNASAVSSSEDEARRKSVFQHNRSPTGENIGPLTRHMNRIMEEESRNQSRISVTEPEPEPFDDSHRRMAMSSESPTEVKLPSKRNTSTRRDTGSTTHTDTPRISIEYFDRDLRPTATNTTLDTITSGDTEDAEHPRKARAHGVNFFKRQKGKHHIAENDFAVTGGTEEPLSSVLSHSPERYSLDVLRRSESYKSLHVFTSSKEHSRSRSNDNLREDDSLFPRPLKAGRVDELVHEEAPFAMESPKSSRNLFFSHKRRGSDEASTPSERRRSSLDMLRPQSKHNHNASPGRQGRRSRSQDIKYRGQKLPTFVSSRSPERRLSRLRDSVFGEGSSDVSPGTSSPDLSRHPTRDNTLDTQKSYQSADQIRQLVPSPSPSQSGSHSRPNSSHAAANRRLDRLLRSPGGVLLGAPLVTGLTGIAAATEREAPTSNETALWNLANNDKGLPKAAQHNSPITRRDIASVRTLLLASGIKAKTLVRISDSIPPTLSPFLAAAARTVNASVSPTPRRQEHVVAAQLLSKHLESTVASFESAAAHFREETCVALDARLDDLREKVASKMTPLVRSCGDEADAFVARLTTTNALAIKQVNDGIDLILRNRRKRFRWARGFGFGLLEYVLVGIMWWIWLFVLVLRVVKNVVFGAGRGFKWMIWS